MSLKKIHDRIKKHSKKVTGQAPPQGQRYSVTDDKKRKSKPGGIRFKGLHNYAKPPAKHTKLAKGGKTKSAVLIKGNFQVNTENDYAGYYDPTEFWNGYRVPWFEKKIIEELAIEIKAMEGSTSLKWENDSLLVYETFDDIITGKKEQITELQETISPKQVTTVDGIKTLYLLQPGWEWALVSNDDNPEHRQRWEKAFVSAPDPKKAHVQVEKAVARFKGKINSVQKIKALFRYIFKDMGIAWMPDDDFKDTVTYFGHEDVEGKPVFTKKDATTMNKLVDECFNYCDKKDLDVYQYAAEVQAEVYKQKGILPKDFAKGGKLTHDMDLHGDVHHNAPGTEMQNLNTQMAEGGPLPEDATQSDVLKEEGGPIESGLPAAGGENSMRVQSVIPTVPNMQTRIFAADKLPFKGTNLEGKILWNGDYLVLSFDCYPVWYWCAAESKWYGNKDRFNTITAMHMEDSRPDFNATQIPLYDLYAKIFGHYQKMEFGGAVMQLYPMSTDNTSIAHA